MDKRKNDRIHFNEYQNGRISACFQVTLKRKEDACGNFEGLLIDTYVLQEQPMMLTGINLQLEDRVINGLLKDRYLAKYILRLP